MQKVLQSTKNAAAAATEAAHQLDNCFKAR